MGYNPLTRGKNSNLTSRSTSTGYQNGQSATIAACTPVSANTAGNIIPTDPTSDASVAAFVGLVQTDLVSGAAGQIVSDGRFERISSSLMFSPGDAIYLGPTAGTLTNIRPDISQVGWSEGMFVVFIGVVVVNEFDSTAQDIQLTRVIVGQL